jgi:outer membrane protein assembly factor BamE (lipoprotein component of BamABCDE complex)|tara:strand:+ start:148 stop:528 length:381 start_codon:yes stop_codon:yes gene_type:complete
MRIVRLITVFGIISLLSSCSISTFGKFQANEGVPTFIQVGKTTREEVLNTLGEPLVHRFVVGKETLIYNHERGDYFFLYGTYEGNELVLRLENQIVVETKIEKTGSGWGFLAPATSNNPGTRRSAR